MELIFVIIRKVLTFPLICYFLQSTVRFFTRLDELESVWAEVWENGAMSCSLSVMGELGRLKCKVSENAA